jgi:hypothetical protein
MGELKGEGGGAKKLGRKKTCRLRDAAAYA